MQDGRIRWVLADGGGMGMPGDGLAGATSVMQAVQEVGTPAAGGSLYDLQGTADALRALAA